MMYRGDDRTFTITVTVDGAVFNLTGCAVRFTMKQHITDTEAYLSLSVGNGITLTTPASGILTVAIPAAATQGVGTDTMFYWDLQITDTNGKVRTAPEPSPGTLFVKSDVTRT